MQRMFSTAGSGTSYHSTLLAKHILSKYSQIRVETVVSSEFQYSSEPNYTENSVLIAISQSGENCRCITVSEIAREKGAKILSIVNVTTSS